MKTQELIPVGIIGLGSMGGFTAREILSGRVPGIRLAGVADIKSPAPDLRQELQSQSVPLVKTFQELADLPLKLAIECANQRVVQECAGFFISRGIDLLIMSIGALIQGSFWADLADQAARMGVHLYIPSGAVGAIDALQAAKLRGLDEVSLTTRKPPRSLSKIDGVNLEELTEPRVLFEGPAVEAVAKFPQNVNVAATISLAGLGPMRTLVRVVADPTIDQNIHEIRARGAFGSLEIRLTNRPSPDNPKTSLLACLSVVSLLRRIQGSVQIGG